MKEIGVVKSLRGNSAQVEIMRHAACGDCGACHMSKEQSKMITMARNSIQAQVGETVEVEMEFANVFTATFIMYGIPLIAFISGCCVSYFLVLALNLNWDLVLTSFFSGIGLTAMSYGVIRFCDRKGLFNSKYQPVITAIIENIEIKKSPMESKMG